MKLLENIVAAREHSADNIVRYLGSKNAHRRAVFILEPLNLCKATFRALTFLFINAKNKMS